MLQFCLINLITVLLNKMFTENVVNSRYFGIDEIQALKLHDKIKSVFLPDKRTLTEQKL